MKLLFDENLPPHWVDFLVDAGEEAVHWTQVGKAGDPDQALLAYALANNAILVTQDLDFTRMLALSEDQLPSIIQLRVACPLPHLVGSTLLEVLEQHRERLRSGCLVSIDSRGHRLRLLPLG